MGCISCEEGENETDLEQYKQMVVNYLSNANSLQGQPYVLSAKEFNQMLVQDSACFLGQGSYGEVTRYRKRAGKTEEYVAVKRQKNYNNEGVLSTLTEAYVLHKMNNSSYIVNCEGVQLEESPPHIMMEHAEGGSLAELAKEGTPVVIGSTEYEILLEYMLDVVEGLIELKEQQIAHRDLKPDNILLFTEECNGVYIKRAKIIDFGLCKYYGSDDKIMQALTESNYGVGNIIYQPPEELVGYECQIENGSYDNSTAQQTKGISISGKTDIYAFGVPYFALLTRKKPYSGLNELQVLVDVPQGLREEIPAHWPEKLRELIGRCWDHDPSVRPEPEEVRDVLIELLEEVEL